ncbi:hypothetical protein BGZ52_011470 [Haplosporangium bisporale]|nr:hypothetical protein BGZ52_011470 [Haplosporangium bisporale]
MSPPVSPTIPPELLEEIFSYITRHDLTQCTRVSRDWAAVSTSLLWKSISIMSSKDFYRFQAPEAQSALIRNERHIREFRTVFVPVIERLVCCTHLTILDLNRIWNTPSPPPPPKFLPLIKGSDWTRLSRFSELELSHMTPDQEQLVLNIIQRNPHLLVLKIGDHFQSREELFSLLTDDLLPNLQDLSLFKAESNMDRETSMELSRDIDTSLETVQKFFEKCPQGIRKLLIDLRNLEQNQDENSGEVGNMDLENELSSPCLQHPDLESLTITGSWAMSASQCQQLLQRFLSSCGRNLKHLSTPCSVHLGIESLMSVLPECDYTLNKVLAATEAMFFYDDNIPQSLSQTLEWTSIDYSKFATVANKSTALQTLYDRCGRLEHINLTECWRLVDSSDVQEILCRSPNLVELQAHTLDAGYNEDCDPHLSVRDIGHGRPWSCSRTLKTLAVKIVDVPRPDITVGHDGRPVEGELFRGSVDESRAIQRRVYNQLAEMKHLEKLYLGRMDDSDFVINTLGTDAEGRNRKVDSMFQLNCLEMSLESGLEVLAGLKEMRVVDLRRMAHCVGPKELEWMQTHWKKLERVSGLFDRWYPALEGGVRDWIEEHDPVWGWEYRKLTFYDNDLCAEQYFWGYNDIWEDYWE